MSIGGGINKSRSNTVTHDENRVVVPKWGKPAIKEYIANLHALQGPAPYAQEGLGYDRATLSMLPGQANDLAAGAKLGAAESIQSTFARPGAPGTGSYAESAALGSLNNEYAARAAEAGRTTAIADASLRRADAERRLRFGLAAGNLARQFATTRGRQRRQFSTVGGQISASTGGASGGGGTPQTPGADTSVE